MNDTEAQNELMARVANDLGYHRPPDQQAADACAELRQYAIDYSQRLISRCPVGRDLSIALTHIEEASRAAVASIAKTWPLA